MTIHNLILAFISINPGVTRDEVIENCINKEFAGKFLKDLIGENKVKSVCTSKGMTYYINE